MAGMHRLLLQKGLAPCLMHPTLPVLEESDPARRIRLAAKAFSQFILRQEGT
jgi:hypothetical protein